MTRVHELSLAMSLVDLAAGCAREAAGAGTGGGRVEAVHVRIGALTGVDGDALRFAFDAASDGTPLAGARLVVEHVPVAVFCGGCGAERTLDEPFRLRCPVCGAPAARVVRGREIELAALEVSEIVSAHR